MRFIPPQRGFNYMSNERLVAVANQFKRLLLDNKLLVVAVVCTTVYLGILDNVLESETMKLDEAAYWLIVENLRQPWLTPIMESFSNLATPVTIVVLWVLVTAFAPGRKVGLCTGVNLILALALNQVMKAIVQRPRPEGFRLAEASGFSFPSGHSMIAMAFFGLLVWFVWRYEKDRVRRILIIVALCVIIAMIGISRIYLGVHFASDVLGGFCLSLVWLVFFTRIIAPLLIADKDIESTPNSTQ